MADALTDFLKSFIKLEKTYFKTIFSREDMQDEIIRLNTHEQLYERGVDSLGQDISPDGYAQFTIDYKRETGQRFDHVTLNDTGAFYDSFAIKVGKDFFIIDADGIKDDDDLFDIYGDDVLGLTDESVDDLQLFVYDVVVEMVENLVKKYA